MKKTALLFLLVAVAALAAPAELGYLPPLGGGVAEVMHSPNYPDVLWENPYSYGDLVNGLTSSGSYHSQDDFTLAADATIEGFEVWCVFTSGPGSAYQLTLFADSGGAPGSQLWTGTPDTVVNTDTGDDQWGYDLYHSDISLAPADYFSGTAGTTYWIEFYYTGGTYYWLCESGGNMYQSGSNTGYDAFFRVNGTAGGDSTPPEVSGMVPGDGDTGVDPGSDIVFHCTDDSSGINTSTIDFDVEDTTMSSGIVVTVSGSNGAISGTLDIDDTDPNDVVCTFTPDADLPPDEITCTVAGTLEDNAGNDMGVDEVWSFQVTGFAVEDSSWGEIKTLE